MRRNTNVILFNQYLDAFQRLAHQPILVEDSAFVKAFYRALRVAVVAAVEGQGVWQLGHTVIVSQRNEKPSFQEETRFLR